MQATGNSTKALIDRLLARLTQEEAAIAPGFRMDTPALPLDEGGYGDPLADDERPEFIRKDEEHWTRIASFPRR